MLYEDAAALFLEREGLQILKRNFRCRFGEIDIIARERDTLVFTEVKFRKSVRTGSPLEAVGFQKQRKILKTALFYMTVNGLDTERPLRFDVVGIDDAGNVTHVRNAFEFSPGDHIL